MDARVVRARGLVRDRARDRDTRRVQARPEPDRDPRSAPDHAGSVFLGRPDDPGNVCRLRGRASVWSVGSDLDTIECAVMSSTQITAAPHVLPEGANP